MAEYFQIPPAAQIIVKDGRLEYRADLLQRPLSIVSRVETANANLSFAWPDLSQHHADRRTFARAIVPEQPKNFSRRHRQVQILDCLPFSKPFRHITKFNHRRLCLHLGYSNWNF